MKWTSLNDLREMYLSFFESKGHLRHKSYPLVPIDDKSILLINAGMTPLKKYFTGEVEPPRHRMTTCQKCIRTPDIERVGITARHGTYFEMLGNFSFGDYFKNEAIPWAWEFCTKVLELPEDKLWVTIYLDDDEAYDIWHNKLGVPAERIVIDSDFGQNVSPYPVDGLYKFLNLLYERVGIDEETLAVMVKKNPAWLMSAGA